MSRRNWTVKQVTRKDFTTEEIRKHLERNNHDLPETAKSLSKLGKGKVSRQTLKYWVNHEDFQDVNSQHFESDALKGKQRMQNTNRVLRRELKAVTETQLTLEEWEEGILRSFESIQSDLPVIKPKLPEGNNGGTRLTVELLVSDLQIGKLTANYNTPIARARVEELGRKAVQAIQAKVDAGYVIERIVVAMLGDIIESDEKHADSARGCDSSTAEQMADAIEVLYKGILIPLAPMSEKLDVIGIAGNHDHNGRGLKSFKAGRTQFNYPIYKALEMLCEVSVPHANFIIPEGTFHVDNIYGSKVLYEHGVGVSVTEDAMRKRKHAVGEQIEAHIFYSRMGDKHNIATFNNSQYVVNGAFFGGGRHGVEYSEVAGYHSHAGQWLGFHTQRRDERTTLFDSYVIQLGHIGG